MSGRRQLLAALIATIAAIAFGISAYLTWVTWQSGLVAGCTAESLLDCDDVLASRWSKWFGLPVSLLGALTYLALLGLSWPAARRSQGMAMAGLFTVAMIAAGAAVWFIGLQAIELQRFCIYCLTVHTCGLVVGVAAWLLFTDTSAISDLDHLRSLLGVATVDFDTDTLDTPSRVSSFRLLATLAISAAGLLILMGGQLLSSPFESMGMEEVDLPALASQPSETEPANHLPDGEPSGQPTAADLTHQSIDDQDWLESSGNSSPEPVIRADQPPPTIGSLLGPDIRGIAFRALPDRVDVTAMPLLGSLQAGHVLVEMMDYTCTHCRKLHPHLRAAVERYGGQLSVVIHHVPLSKKCNPNVEKDYPGKKYACDYAQLAIGVWNLAPEKFAGYHDWLLESEKPPSVSKARSRAMSLVGEEVLLDKKAKADISKRLAKQSADLKRLNIGLPVLLFTGGALRGVPEESQALFDYIENELGIEPRSSAD